jgi:hypothetical protein
VSSRFLLHYFRVSRSPSKGVDEFILQIDSQKYKENTNIALKTLCYQIGSEIIKRRCFNSTGLLSSCIYGPIILGGLNRIPPKETQTVNLPSTVLHQFYMVTFKFSLRD